MRRPMVTGAAGFIGSHLVDALLARGDQVVGVDAFTDYYDPARKRANIAAARDRGLRLVTGDLCHVELGSLLDGVDTVYHLAGQPGVRPSFGREFELYAQRNLVATQRLLEACLHRGVQRFVFASSSSVYGNTRGERVAEEAPRRPASPYGLTKAACEDLLAVYRRDAGLSATSLRYFTVYGPRQRPEMAFATFIDRVLADAPIPVYGDGEQSRDFTYVEDVVAGTLAAADHGTATVYNLSGGSAATLREAIELIESLTGRRARLDRRPDARGDVRSTRADLTAAVRDLGYRPRVSLVEGLEAQLRWARAARPAEAAAA